MYDDNYGCMHDDSYGSIYDDSYVPLTSMQKFYNMFGDSDSVEEFHGCSKFP